MGHLSHPDPDLVYTCPECDVANVNIRDPDHPPSKGDTEYWCYNCDAEFEEDDIQERPPRITPHNHGNGARSNLEVLIEENPSILEEHGGPDWDDPDAEEAGGA